MEYVKPAPQDSLEKTVQLGVLIRPTGCFVAAVANAVHLNPTIYLDVCIMPAPQDSLEEIVQFGVFIRPTDCFV